MRKAAAEEKRQRFATGGGTVAAPFSAKYADFLSEPVMKELAAMISLSVDGQKSSFDSDKRFVAPETVDTPATAIDVDNENTQTQTQTRFGVTMNPNDPNDPNASLNLIVEETESMPNDSPFVEEYLLDDNGYLHRVSAPHSPTETDLIQLNEQMEVVATRNTSVSGASDVKVGNSSNELIAVAEIKPEAKPSGDNLQAQWNKYSANMLRSKKNALLTTKRRRTGIDETEPKRVCGAEAAAVLTSTQTQMEQLHQLRLEREKIAIEKEKLSMEREQQALLNEKLRTKLLEFEVKRAKSKSSRRRRRRRRSSSTDVSYESVPESDVATPTTSPSLGGWDDGIDHTTYPNSNNPTPEPQM